MRNRGRIAGQIGQSGRFGKARGAWRHLQLPGRRAAGGQQQAQAKADSGPDHRRLPWLLIACLCGAIAPDLASAQKIAPIAAVRSPPANPVPSGQPVPLTLAETVALGLRDNRTIKSAYLQRVAQKFDLFVADTLFLPKLNLSADIAHQRVGGTTFNTSSVGAAGTWLTPIGTRVQFSWDRRDQLDSGRTGHSDTAALSFTQPLLRGAGTKVNMAPVRIARLQEEINKLSLKSTVIDTVTGIIQAYRRLSQAQSQVELAELSLERTRDLLETNRALIVAGRMAAADIVQTESGVANQEVAVLQARQQLASAQLALLQLLAVDPRTNVVAADEPDAEQADIDLDRVVDLGLSSRVDILGQRLALEQTRIDLAVARNNRLWDLSIGGSVSRQRVDDPILGRLDPPTDHNVGVQLSIPIGDFSYRQREIGATTSLRTAELRYQDLTQSVETQIRDAVQTVEASWQQLVAARRARALAARALELQQEKLKVGRASNFEVLSFQADLRTADTQELAARIGYLNALTSLDQQIGNTLETWRISLND
ncbi:TolC family protein [Sphingomonas fennica]|uniref:TolC family protein n=1 Tax=Edaphosphingomonas fennica TaxID=114404 RepID=A0A2T4I5E9_9SPHN|nr:TolC family protein [Sphingomonas fennica]